MWNMIGRQLDTSEMVPGSVPVVCQAFTLSSTGPQKILRGVVAGLIAHNPTFTGLCMELWSDNGGASKLIATSTNTKARSDLLPTSDNYGKCDVPFTFADVPLRAGTKYWLALKAATYTYSSSAHLAWRHSWPDPQYASGFDKNVVHAGTHPLEFTLIMGDL